MKKIYIYIKQLFYLMSFTVYLLLCLLKTGKFGWDIKIPRLSNKIFLHLKLDYMVLKDVLMLRVKSTQI